MTYTRLDMKILNLKSQLIQTVSKAGKANVTNIVNNLPSRRSRQWISLTLSQLTKEEKLVRSKEGKFVFYVLPNRLDLLGKKITKTFRNQNIDEDSVFEELSGSSPFITKLSEDVSSIVRYAFTEMVNNVGDHSKASSMKVSIEEAGDKIIFEVMDDGIGVFRNIMQKKELASETEAVQELLKGKTTTLPHSHSGEGIFFTSKIADVFVSESFGYRLRVDNTLPDIFVEEVGPFAGTRVRFEINKNSKKHLGDLFREYEAEPGSYSFDKTKVLVKLFKAGSVYISRSQAKRLMANLEKFRLIILDFQGIKTVGQAFADEVFRVFSSNHPNTRIEAINTGETVEFMIRRVQKP